MQNQKHSPHHSTSTLTESIKSVITLRQVCPGGIVFTHFGVSVAMNNHWQRVVRRVSNSHAACSKLEEHLVCQQGEQETFQARL